jgi:polynucleotide 5'-hydroxyl-kinase GRC3/NOL9
MKRMIEKDKTLLVDGPASVTLCSGKVEVFGSAPAVGSKVVIREGKRLPFAVLEKSELELSVGDTAAVEEIDGNTIPASWRESAEELLKLQGKPATAIVLGTVDSGKSSYCTYLLNRILAQKRKVTILDGDLGQSDIGPPSTIAYAVVSKPITDPFYLQARNACFIGETSAGNVADQMILALSSLKKEITSREPEFLIINTDGWIDGECAIDYKMKLVEELKPDVVFFLQQKDELAPILNRLESHRKILVESPSAIRQRDREKRKSLRELGYKKYLRNPKVQSFSLSWVKVEKDEAFGLSKSRTLTRQVRKVTELLGMKPLHVAELTDRINIIIGRKRWINPDNLKNIQEHTKKRIVVTRKGEEEGLLVGLYDGNGKFLGIGAIQEIDYVRKAVKVLTPTSEEVSTMVLGKVRLDKNMKEIPPPEENNVDFASFKKLF